MPETHQVLVNQQDEATKLLLLDFSLFHFLFLSLPMVYVYVRISDSTTSANFMDEEELGFPAELTRLFNLSIAKGDE